jgi:hypothetical protein
MSSRLDREAKFIVTMWAFCVLFGLAFWVGVGYVAFHFITKFW